MKDWCSELTQLVGRWLEDSRKKLEGTVMSSENPAMLKFAKNDVSSVLEHTLIGFLTTVPVPPDVSHSSIQFEKKELTTIVEEEVRLYIIVWLVFLIFLSGVWRNLKVEPGICGGRQVE